MKQSKIDIRMVKSINDAKSKAKKEVEKFRPVTFMDIFTSVILNISKYQDDIERQKKERSDYSTQCEKMIGTSDAI